MEISIVVDVASYRLGGHALHRLQLQGVVVDGQVLEDLAWVALED